MAQSDFAVQRVDDDSWRRELCPDCGARLIGFAEWKDHGPRHGWGPDWLAARVRAGRAAAVCAASMNKIGRYHQDRESNQKESILSKRVGERRGTTRRTGAETAGPKGRAKEIWKRGMAPPFGFELQVLEGPSKGSKQ